MPKWISAAAALVIVATTSAPGLAGEPVRLTAGEMDLISAGQPNVLINVNIVNAFSVFGDATAVGIQEANPDINMGIAAPPGSVDPGPVFPPGSFF